MERPFLCHNNREHNSNSSGLDDGAKCINVVKTKYLCISIGNKMGFEAHNKSIKQIFSLKNPFRTHNIGVSRARNENPSTVILECMNIFVHGNKPSKILNS